MKTLLALTLLLGVAFGKPSLCESEPGALALRD